MLTEMQHGAAAWNEIVEQQNGEYVPGELDKTLVNKNVKREPPQLKFWSQEEDKSVVAIKVYFVDAVDIILMKKPFPLIQLERKVSAMHNVGRVELRALYSDGKLRPLVSEADLTEVLRQEGTIKVIARKDEDALDLITFSSLVQTVPNPTMMVSLLSKDAALFNSSHISHCNVGKPLSSTKLLGKDLSLDLSAPKLWQVSFINTAMESKLGGSSQTVCGRPAAEVFPCIEFETELPKQPVATYLLPSDAAERIRKSGKRMTVEERKEYMKVHGVRVIASCSHIAKGVILIQINCLTASLELTELSTTATTAGIQPDPEIAAVEEEEDEDDGIEEGEGEGEEEEEEEECKLKGKDPLDTPRSKRLYQIAGNGEEEGSLLSGDATPPVSARSLALDDDYNILNTQSSDFGADDNFDDDEFIDLKLPVALLDLIEAALFDPVPGMSSEEQCKNLLACLDMCEWTGPQLLLALEDVYIKVNELQETKRKVSKTNSVEAREISERFHEAHEKSFTEKRKNGRMSSVERDSFIQPVAKDIGVKNHVALKVCSFLNVWAAERPDLVVNSTAVLRRFDQLAKKV